MNNQDQNQNQIQNQNQFPQRNIIDKPLSNEQIYLAQNVLDDQRHYDDEIFKQIIHPPQLQQHLPPQIHYIYPHQLPQIPHQLPQIPHQLSTNFSNQFPWNPVPPFPEFLDPKKSVDIKLIRKKEYKKDSRCYTCKPRGKVKKHIINSSSSGNFVFHHDMHKRPVIIITSSRHIDNMNGMTSDELIDLFKSIKEFTNFWNVDDYQLSFNFGRWQNHEHFHCKIRLSEKIINRMRRDHFTKIKFDNRYPDN
jgi:hypothetical protein